MAGRRTNIALFWVSLLALASGGAAFLVGTSGGWWVVAGHGVLGLAIVVLAPWKSVIVARALPRPRPGRILSIAVSLSTLGALASGVILITGWTAFIGPFTTMQIHVASGLMTVSLMLVHTLQRPVPMRSSDLTRRNLLRAGGVLAGAAALWVVGEGALDTFGVSGGERRFTGSHEIRDPARIPPTQWLNDQIPSIDETHQVVVVGTALPTADLIGQTEVKATLDCTGGWHTTQIWSGTRLSDLHLGEGRSIIVRSVTGYWRRFPIEQAGSLYLATHVAGDSLRPGNGGPVRLVAPGRRGYWWVKWVDRIEVDDRPAWWQPLLPTA